MKWTDVKPSKPGWYWYRHPRWDDIAPVIVQLVVVPQTGELTILWTATNQPVCDYIGDGQWSDAPIEEPGEQ